MDGGEKFFAPGRVEKLPPLPGDEEVFPPQGLGGSRAEGDDQFRSQDSKLGLKPWATGGDFAGIRLLVEAALSGRLPLEMLHCIGDVGFPSIEAGGFENTIEESSRRTDKGFSFDVFPVSRNFADQDDLRVFGSFAKDGLGAVLP